MILCAGEILADMIGAERDGVFVYERKAGGAPFNVACAVKKFGVKSAFAGSVGDDIIDNLIIFIRYIYTLMPTVPSKAFKIKLSTPLAVGVTVPSAHFAK